MARKSLIRELLGFVAHERKWWMIPLLAVLLVIGVLLGLAAMSGPLAPFIYPLF